MVNGLGCGHNSELLHIRGWRTQYESEEVDGMAVVPWSWFMVHKTQSLKTSVLNQSLEIMKHKMSVEAWVGREQELLGEFEAGAIARRTSCGISMRRWLACRTRAQITRRWCP